MRENTKLSETILKIIADSKSYPARIEPLDIRNNDAIKENFKDISNNKIVFHAKILEEAGLIDAKFRDKEALNSATRFVSIIGLTKKGSDLVEYIESPFWKRAIKRFEKRQETTNYGINI